MPSDAAGLSAAYDQPVDVTSKPDFVLGILEPRDINILAGASGTGKWRLLLCELNRYFEEQSFFGRRGASIPRMGMICRRRKLSQIQRIIKSLHLTHLTPQNFPIICMGREQGSSETIEGAYKHFTIPPTLLIVQSIQSLLPQGNVNDIAGVSSFYEDLGDFCERNRVTILATAYTSKQKMNEGYERSSDRVLGSSGWVDGGTVMVLDFPEGVTDETCNQRRLTISIPDESPIRLYFEFASNGKMIPLRQVEGWRAKMLAHLETWPVEDPIRTGEIIAWGAQEQIPRITITRWIAELFENGEITKLRHGMWKKMRSN